MRDFESHFRKFINASVELCWSSAILSRLWRWESKNTKDKMIISEDNKFSLMTALKILERDKNYDSSE